MENPFEIIARRLSNIEDLLLDIKHRPSPGPTSQSLSRSKKIDFQAARDEYYPNIPESTVRQLTAHLSRTKVGKRILLDRDEIEQDQIEKRRKSSKTLAQEIDVQFASQHQRKGGQKSV
ncbi:hypothetical protein GO755_38025 [Spirosoma sp. HMF4905]|uniref:Uncharacterized protein n=1 Tax=Spirosoma arboris TaxID=2682092 RepID=A0A7K1SPY7_9BACT|nr:hypothetical protein [Spirosoma arboris]MVM35875.1 hypothetical protein [Spirosoma arboris]